MNRSKGWFVDGGRSARVGMLESLESRRLMSSSLLLDAAGILPTDSVTVNGVAYFAADDGVHGRELWRSDGTQAGTRMVHDANPGPLGSELIYLTALGDRVLYFIRGDTVDLWQSDGTEAGTTRLATIDSELYPSGHAVANGKLIFLIHHRDSDAWLWSSDGTEAGTGPIVLIRANEGGGVGTRVHALGDRVVLLDDDDLWSSDGTAEGTFLIPPPNGAGWGGDAWFNPVVNGRFILVNGYELWGTDGTLAGTNLIAPLPGGAASFRTAKDRVVFTTHENGYALWSTDGTTGGTGIIGSVASDFVTSGTVMGNLLFTATASSQGSDGLFDGAQLVVTDGTTGGTTQFKISDDYFQFSDKWVVAGGLVFFATWNVETSEYRLWASDGTAAGTQVVQDLTQTIHSLPELAEVEGKVAVVPYGGQTQLFDPASLAAPMGPVQGSISVKDGVMRIHGTLGDDAIRIYHHTSAADRFVVNLNGVKKSFAIAAVSRIYIYGYSGNDNLSFYDGYGRVSTRSRIWGGAGNDSIYTGLNRDTLYGDAGEDNLNSGANDDILMGGDGDDLVNAGFGNDTASGENGSDHVSGGQGSDIVSGGADGSQDWVDGGFGADVIFGSAVFDTFFRSGQTGDPLDEILV